MSQSLAKIYVHIVFSTKNRLNLITNNITQELYAYMASIVKANDSLIIKIGGTENHVHILCTLSKNYSLCKLVEKIKKSSSRWIKTKNIKFSKFAWQTGYGAFSACQSQIENIKQYIELQSEHHKKISFENELKNILKKYNIDYDEKYLWN